MKDSGGVGGVGEGTRGREKREGLGDGEAAGGGHAL